MGTGSLAGVKRLGRGVDHPPPSSAEVKERVELYLYSSYGTGRGVGKKSVLITNNYLQLFTITYNYLQIIYNYLKLLTITYKLFTITYN